MESSLGTVAEHKPDSTGLSRNILIAIGLFLLTLGIYWFSAVLLTRTQSRSDAYFEYQAAALLHGQTYLEHPLSTHDLTFYQGHWYVPFLPLPAWLLLPWVALQGAANVNTVAFGAAMGAINVALAFLLLQALVQRGWTRLKLSDNLWLTALWALGSVHWYMSIPGSVWFVSQICTVTFVLLAVVLAATTGSPWLAGTALALAVWGRPTIALSYPLVLAIGMAYLGTRPPGRTWRAGLTWGLAAFVPLAISGLALLGYNYLRFHSPLDFGYLTENIDPKLAGDLRRFGQFNLHYVPHNLWAMLLAGPVFDPHTNSIWPTVDGMSLLLTTPALVYVAAAFRRSPLIVGSWISVGLLLIPLLTYYNTGWWQFGYRFSLDFMTPLLVLLAIGAGTRTSWLMRALIVLGVLVNAWGVWWFQNPRFFS
jgi:hypothetical protein